MNANSAKHQLKRGLPAYLIRFLPLLVLLLGSALLYGSHLKPEPTHPSPSPHNAIGPLAGEVVRGPRGRSEIALTFDAGANIECFDDLIATLEKAHVHSTFFITGNWAQQHSDCAQAITKHGHEVGNHTWNHFDLTRQPDHIIRQEITRAETLLTEMSGQNPRPRWRAPFGARDKRVLQIASNLGYKSIYWTIDSLDSVEPRKTSGFLIDRITSYSDSELDGAIILMHVGERSTAESLPAIISNLQGRGFDLVTISTLLRGN
jgi:peptidoglycan/xylan/chitin deacetylase (PgdA/CDA1 family)